MVTGIKDIARELGVSLATVSRALADSPDVSAETKERVWVAANALNYHPNLMARSLRSKRSRVIGVVVQGDDYVDRGGVSGCNVSGHRDSVARE